jgi:hypothetical protein
LLNDVIAGLLTGREQKADIAAALRTRLAPLMAGCREQGCLRGRHLVAA